MAEIIYTGDAPAFAQEEWHFLTGTAGEGASLLATIGRKTLRVQATTVRESIESDDSDDDTLEDLIDAVVAAWNDTDMPEFAEVTASKGTNQLGTPYLKLVSKVAGRPFTVALTNPSPTVDIDTTTEGVGPLPEIETFYLDPTPTGGTYRVLWNLGSGLESSGAIAFDGDADAVKAAMVAGMASITDDNLTVTGSGTEGSPFILTLGDDLDDTSVSQLLIDASGLTGNGEVFISTVTEGGQAGTGTTLVTDTFTDTNGTNLSSHTSDSTDTWANTDGDDPVIQSNTVRWTISASLDQDNLMRVAGNIDDDIVASFRLGNQIAGARSSHGTRHGFFFRYSDTTHYMVCELYLAGDNQSYIVVGKQDGATFTILAQQLVSDLQNEYVDLTLRAIGSSITVEGETSLGNAVSISTVSTFNIDELICGLHLWYNAGTNNDYMYVDTLTIASASVSDEVQSVYHNGQGGSFTLTFGGQTATIPAGSTSTEVDTLLTALSSIDACTVTGSGTAEDPYLVTFTGTHAGTNVAQMTGSGTNLTGGYDGIVETTQQGGAGTNEVQSITFTATGGTLTYSFGGFTTAAIAYNASTATLQTALQGLASIGSGNATVSGSAGAYVVTFAGDLASTDVEQISVDTTSLTGSTQVTVTTVTVQASKGPRHWDDPLNWRDASSGVKGIPATGDTVYIETGDAARSLLYGLDQSAVDLDGLYINSKAEGNFWIGLPNYNPNGYCEYRQTYLKIGFQGSKVLVIGEGDGGGASRLNIDSDGTAVDIRVLRTGGRETDAHAVLNVKNTHANSTLKLYGSGSVALAPDPGTSAPFASIVQTNGVLLLCEGATIGAGSGRVIDKTGGTIIIRDAAINGDVYGA